MNHSLPQPARSLTSDREPPQRIAKVLARAGLCSRRDAERWIAEGRVTVDGRVLKTPAVTVTTESQIRVDGKPLPEPERARLWRYHKPVGLVTTHRDEKDRPTVFGALRSGWTRNQKEGHRKCQHHVHEHLHTSVRRWRLRAFRLPPKLGSMLHLLHGV